MAIKTYKPYTPSRRHMTGSDFSEITKKTPEKSLTVALKKNSGRNNQGKITSRHRGGGNKRRYRLVDFKRNSKDQSAFIALVIRRDHFSYRGTLQSRAWMLRKATWKYAQSQ